MRDFLAAAAILALVVPAFAQDTRTVTDDAGRVVEIPADPQRIVSLQDLFFSVPLIELGVVPVGSHGRSNGEGTQPFMRSSKMMTGVDFDTADITFVGTGTEIDPEAVAAVEPDLIVLSTNQDPELFASIAPTILLDFNLSDKFALYDRLAEITGTEHNLALLKVRYEQQLAQLKAVVDTPAISVNVIAAVEGQVRSYRHFAALGRVLDEAGFDMPDAVKDVPYGQYADFSPEMLPQMDADLVLVTYRAEQGETAQDAYDQLEAAVPGFCSFLTACQNGRVIAIPRDETFVTSYGALGMLAYSMIALTATPAN
ncbi:ABC transporter substrate-binding protein [Devosia sp. SL43]|uniref:ABC transporter substrate-binding protein n=1 Tax=Devosia sp. SL43 TaxID=2806348 RepID=UPI001F1E04C0|nr:ABC transporter substrate-binding protein [Devosia sp. SL43]UJW86057.1 ABC transporter substrate-binding protein [Devosia sp. SL43]